MDTLELVKQGKAMSAIVVKAELEGFSVLEASNYHVKVEAGCLPVNITWGMCGCHGGRMWIVQDNANIEIELSSSEYDEDAGIVDPETELAFYIDNKMADAIRGFEKYVYVVEKIGEYSEDSVCTYYFNSVEKASRYIFGEDGHDVNSEYGTVVCQYPNPDMRERITYVGCDHDSLKFKGEKLRNKSGEFETEKEYEIKFRIFKKKK